MKGISLKAAWIACVLGGILFSVNFSNAQTLKVYKDGNSGRPVFLTIDPAKSLRVQLAGTTAAKRVLSKRKIRKGKFQDAVLVSDEFLETNKAVIGLRDVTGELLPVSVDKDSIGKTHVRYRQQYKGILVVGGEVSVHLDKYNQVYAVSTMFTPMQPVELKSRIPARKAQVIAASAMTNDFHLLSKPVVYSTSQVVYQGGIIENLSDARPHLAWEIQIRSGNPGSSHADENYYIDAISGKILKHLSNIRYLNRRIYDCTPLLWSDYCWINKRFTDPPHYPDYVFGRGEGKLVRGVNPVYGQAQVDYMYDLVPDINAYYQLKFLRDGPNGYGGTRAQPDAQYTDINTYQEASPRWQNCPNATYTRGVLGFCSNSLTLDTIGHEYAHAVPYVKFGGLFYEGESGAVEENFADIMGESLEKHMTGLVDWVSPTGTINQPIGLPRNLADPPSTLTSKGRPHPDRVFSPDYICDDLRHAVHTNSTVMSKAFFLMAQGGQFNGCTIQPVGFDAIEQIIFRAMAQYYVSSESFYQAFLHVLQSCSDLYGSDSTICANARRALQAVEVDQTGRCAGGTWHTPACRDFDGDGIFDIDDPCTDYSDGNIFQAGKVIVQPGGEARISSCKLRTTLIKYSCQDNIPKLSAYFCGNGKCIDGQNGEGSYCLN